MYFLFTFIFLIAIAAIGGLIVSNIYLIRLLEKKIILEKANNPLEVAQLIETMDKKDEVKEKWEVKESVELPLGWQP